MAAERMGLEAVLDDANFQAGLHRYISGLSKAESKTSSTAGSLTGQLTNLGNEVLKVGALMGTALVAGALAAGAAVATFVGSSISGAADMEQQLADIQAVLGATTEDVGLLADEIIRLGLDPQLKVTATEAAQAMELLARNGLEVEDILGGAAEATVLLANATGADFGASASVATNTMAAFGLEADEMIRAVDGITSVTTNSKFKLDDYALALAQGGGVAGQFGVELEDFNTFLASSAQFFSSGSDAGTAFKTMLLRLNPKSAEATDLMRELGIITADGANQFFDAEGNMRSLAEMAGVLNQAMFGTATQMVEVGGRTADQNQALNELRDAYLDIQDDILSYMIGEESVGITEAKRAEKLTELRQRQQELVAAMAPLEAIHGDLIETTSQLTEQQRLEALSTIFGTDAIRAASAMASLGEEAFADLRDTMGDTSATDMAAIRMDTLRGRLDILKGVFEAVKLEVGGAFLPALTNLADALLRTASDVGPKVIDFFQRAAGFITDFVGNLQEGQSPLNAFVGALENFGIPADIMQRIQDTASAIDDFVERVATFVSDHSEAFKGALAGIGAVLAGAAIAAAIAGIAGAIAALVSPIGILIAGAALLGAAWSENWLGIRDTVTEVWEGHIRPFLEELRPLVEEVIGVAATTFSELKTAIQEGQSPIETVTGLLDNFLPPDVVARVGDFLQLISDLASYFIGVAESGKPLNDFLTRLPEPLRPVAQAFGEWSAKAQEVREEIGQFISEVGQKFTNWIDENGPLIREFAAVLGRVAAVVGGVLAIAWAKAQTAVLDMWTFVEPILSGLIDLILNLVAFVMNVVTGNWEEAWDNLKAAPQIFLDTLRETLSGLGTWLLNIFGTSWEEVKAGWTEFWTGVGDKAAEIWENIKTTIQTAVTDVQTWLAEQWLAIQMDVTTAWDAVVLAVTTAIDNLSAGVNERIAAIKQFFVDLWLAIQEGAVAQWEAIKTAVLEAVVSLFEAMGLDFDEMVTKWSQIWADVQFLAEYYWGLITAKATEIFNSIVTTVSTAVESVRSWIDTKINEARAGWELALNAIWAKVEPIWTLISTTVQTKVEEVRLWIDTKIHEAQAIWDTVWGAIQTKVDEIWGLITTAVSTKIEEMRSSISAKVSETQTDWNTRWDEIKTKVGQIWDSIVETVTGLAQDVYDAAIEPMEDLWTWVTDNVDKFLQMGRDLVQGIIDGIAEWAGNLFSAVTDLIANALAGARAAAEAESPSQKMYEQGQDFVQGMIDGINSMAPDLYNTVSGLGTGAIAEAVAWGTTLGESLVEVIETTTAEGHLFEVFTNVAGALSSMGGVFSSIFTTSTLDPLLAQLDDLDSQIMDVGDSLRSSSDSLTDLSDQELIDLFGASASMGFTNLTDYQFDLLSQMVGLDADRVALAADYAAEQEKVLALQQLQADLDLLTAQQDLLNLIAGYGLDASQILAGVELGLDADIGSLLQATADAMAQIIAAAEDELDIGSPSGVFEGVGRAIIDGLEKGLAAPIPDFGGLITNIIEPIMPSQTSVPPPIYVDGGSSSAEYHLSLTTTQTEMSVQSAFRLMELLDA